MWVGKRQQSGCFLVSAKERQLLQTHSYLPTLHLPLCLLLRGVTESQTRSDAWQVSTTLQVFFFPPRLFAPPRFPCFCCVFILREFTIPSNTHSCSALPAPRPPPTHPSFLPSPWAKILIGWRRAVVTLLSLNQSFCQCLWHLLPSSLSLATRRVCLPPPGTRLSGRTCLPLALLSAARWNVVIIPQNNKRHMAKPRSSIGPESKF